MSTLTSAALSSEKVHRFAFLFALLAWLSQPLRAGPFDSSANLHVLLFVRTDCPLTNRYAPELRRIAAKFSPRGVDFWLVYPDQSETAVHIEAQIAAYGLPGKWILDPQQTLTRRAQASVAPEAAVFDKQGTLLYHGRIDNRWVDFGKARPAATEHDLEDTLNAVFSGQPVPHPQTRAVGCALADVK